MSAPRKPPDEHSESYKRAGPAFTVRISNEKKDAVDARADELGLSRNQVLAALIDGFLDGSIEISRPRAQGLLKLPNN